MKTNVINRQSLAETPNKVLAFLKGVASTPAARAVLASYGYTSHEHELGWSLLRAVINDSSADSGGSAEKAPQLAAMDAVEAFLETGLRRAHAALNRLFPEDAVAVFEGIEAAHGIAAVIAVETFLDRVEELHAKPRKLLVERGVTPAVVKE
jgi:hypothetical protein